MEWEWVWEEVMDHGSMIIGVTGGKGGTGKSTFAVNISSLLSRKYRVKLIDADVECPNDHILFSKELKNEVRERIFIPSFNYQKCIKCSLCQKNCSENAIVMFKNGYPFLLPNLCSSCKTCYIVCPTKAIESGSKFIGSTFITEINENLTLVTGMLDPGQERSYPMVLRTLDRANEIKSEITIIDTSAGTGNHVAASLMDAEIVFAVTEETPLGLHDLEMIERLIEKMDKMYYVIVNRHGISDINIKEKVLGKIPYDERIAESYYRGIPAVEMFKNTDIENYFLEPLMEVGLWQK
ncbi:MAG: P-loop NTPase [Thermoplasmata archaeon]